MTREARTGQETDRIDLWLAWPDASEDSSLIERYTALVTNEERARARRFHFPRDRHNYVVTPAWSELLFLGTLPWAPRRSRTRRRRCRREGNLRGFVPNCSQNWEREQPNGHDVKKETSDGCTRNQRQEGRLRGVSAQRPLVAGGGFVPQWATHST
jgi:hypothetical protein